MTISSKLLLENVVYRCFPGTPTTCRFKTLINSAGNVEEPRIYTKYILFVKAANSFLE